MTKLNQDCIIQASALAVLKARFGGGMFAECDHARVAWNKAAQSKSDE
jgi:hypothetical protein